MTPTELRAELTTDPAGLGYAPLLAAGDDAGVASLLNRADRPGYVPARHAVAELARVGKWGMVPLAVLHRLLPNSTACPMPLYYLFAAIHLAAFGSVEPPLRLEVGPLTAALAAVVGAGLLTQAEADSIAGGEVKMSRAEQVGGYGDGVTAAEVESVRKGNS